MASKNRRGGIIQFIIGGERYDAKGSFTYNFGAEKREEIIGADEVHGYMAKPQAPFIEGEITDRGDLDVRAMLEADDLTAALLLPNGKTFTLRDAWFSGEGNIGTEEGNIAGKWTGLSADES